MKDKDFKELVGNWKWSMEGLTEGERIKQHEFLRNELLRQEEKDTYTNSVHRTSYEETIEAIVDVYRQEFMKLSIEELESIPAKVIEAHSWSIPYMVAGERDED